MIKKPGGIKMTIFMRILLATMLPVLYILAIVALAGLLVIQMDGTVYANEFTRLVTKHISEQISIRIENVSTVQKAIVSNLSELDLTLPNADQSAENLLKTLVASNEDIHCAWLSLAPEASEKEYFKAIFQTNTGTSIHIDKPQDYESIIQQSQAFTISYPITIRNGGYGILSVDIRYSDLLLTKNQVGESVMRVMLTSVGQDVFFSQSGVVEGLLSGGAFQDPETITRAMAFGEVWQDDITSQVSGEKLIACLYPVSAYSPIAQLYVYCEVPANHFYKSFYASMELVIAAVVAGFLMFTISVFLSTRSIVRHVKRITDSFNNVANNSAEGTLDGEHIPVDQTNIEELDTLQSALVKMMMQLRWAHGHKLKALEDEIERENLIASAAAKTNFFAAMSHEIRTPMNAIIGISEIMLHESELTPSQEKYIQDIKISADSLLNIINDILDISKLETGKMELRPEHYNFRMLIDNIVSLSTHLAAGANLRFVFEHETELPLCLYGDGIRLRQVLLNIIGNAIKFTRAGHVTLRVTTGERLCLSVSDTGIGIKEEDFESIFETFKQTDTKRNRSVNGTGLGLSIARNLVEIMGGSISVESVYGTGSTFTISLPLVLGDYKKLLNMRLHTDMRYSESLRVLIVDDDSTNLNVSSGLMRAAHGIVCDTATSGREAIAKVLETDYDIIFMDHMMPELDGVDTTQRIRQLGEQYKALPIIALTANAVIGTREELINQGMDDFIAKPIQSEKLNDILNTWVPKDKRLPVRDYGHYDESAMRKAGLDEAGERLLSEAGINIYTGMENIGFDAGMYGRSLHLLSDRLHQVLPATVRMLEDGNLRGFHVLVHGIKGSLASVGAIELSHVAEGIEGHAAIGNIKDCLEEFGQLCNDLWELREKIDLAWPDDVTSGGSGLDDKERLAGLERLYVALEGYDYEAITREIEELANDGDDELANAAVMIGNFDYAGAAEVVRGIIERSC